MLKDIFGTKGINTDTGNDVTTTILGYYGFGDGLIIASNNSDTGIDEYDTFSEGIYYSQLRTTNT